MRAIFPAILLTPLLLSSTLHAQQSDVQIAPQATRLPTERLGPFVHTSDGNVLALDSEATFISDDGRIIFTAMKMQHDPGRHAVLTYSSTDDGRSWTASNLIDLSGRGHHGGVTEPTLTELPDGRLWMLIRTNWREFWSAFSHDGGRFWRTVKPSGIR